ncbi:MULTISPECIES: Scr1 family TA system antitoxin-like transcriptional regulator [Protofrankia]|uniref:Scr1 family TA system antitoxin-like transcriptional regulator n=1 Tax=Protofrankia TaxID=2994361 RepID=UPI001ED933BA|nr:MULTISPECIES: Scr1 family TA system antitoxin-like transcriptional regulator [Protofrankia]
MGTQLTRQERTRRDLPTSSRFCNYLYRQNRLTGDSPPRLWVILDEAVLHRS